MAVGPDSCGFTAGLEHIVEMNRPAMMVCQRCIVWWELCAGLRTAHATRVAFLDMWLWWPTGAAREQSGLRHDGHSYPTTKTKKDLMPPGNLEATPKSFPKEGTRSWPRNLNGA